MSQSEDIDENSVTPDPGLILESLRALGYTFGTAVADIIDNSIAAGARNIWVDSVANAEYLMISDDGCGLTKEELINSLKLGSQDPLIKRDDRDLGRFGLGLKLASFSYCRKFTVASKKDGGEIVARQWDMDFVRDEHKWQLRVPDISDYPHIKKKLDSITHGTVVFWENIDRFVKPDKKCLESESEIRWYGERIRDVYRHLEMVFHRFLEDGDFMLFLGGTEAIPWNPFLLDPLHQHHYPRSKPLASDLSISQIEVHPYVLPHKSKFSNDTDYNAATGPLKTWSRAQGFYVYRGKRLITAGSWLGFKGCTKSHDTDLARIQLDISNELDSDWMLDVKKSTIRIPREYYKKLQDIALKTRDAARNVKLYRGKVSRREHPGDYSFLWEMDKNRNGEIRYKVNRNHPVIKEFLNRYSETDKKCVNDILHLIEETVPTQGIILAELQNPDSVPEPFEDLDTNHLKILLKTTMSLLNLESLTMDEKRRTILSIEPFSEYEKIIDELLDEVEER